ncbi:MAG: methyltransferase regulatory domain-containing protein, partial [Anaerolineales bacterium]
MPQKEPNIPQPTSYDHIPYPSSAYSGTHPDRLATLAVISGLKPPDVAHCRMLELASSDGGNLIPLAYALPESRFIGVDNSLEEVTRGKALIDELGLTNVELHHLDIAEIEAGLGTFDYIVAYGVYSWVPPYVQDKILQICREHLSPTGVAYVSYNTLPGWHLFGIMRDLLLHVTRAETEPERRIERARQMLALINDVVPEDADLYGRLLRSITTMLGSLSNSYIFHDFMEEWNEPVYFEEFIARARDHGLQFLGNADHSRTNAQRLDDKTGNALLQLSDDPIEQEQYADFLLNASFRQTALVHAEVKLNRTIKADCVTRLQVSSQVRPTDAEMDVASLEPAEFVTPDGESTLTVPHPLTKAAIACLGECWPHTVTFAELCKRASARLAVAGGTAPTSTDIEQLKTNLLAGYGQSPGLIEFHTYSPVLTTDIAPHPQGSLIARYQA